MIRIAGGIALTMCICVGMNRIEGRMRGPVQDGRSADTVAAGNERPVSFKKDVTPIIGKHCLPCHAEDNYNPSELSLDSYNDLMEGGKHGKPVVAGDATGSILIKKLRADPPFGHPMPLKKKRDPEQKYLSAEEIKTISRWIEEGAKNN